MPLYTTTSSWVQLILAGAQNLGLDIDGALDSAGITLMQLTDTQHRFSQQQVSEVWHYLEHSYDNPGLALAIGKEIQLQHAPVLGYSLLSSRTLGEALIRLQRFHSLIGEAVAISVEHHEDEVRLYFDARQELLRYPIETAMVALVAMTRWLTGQTVAPRLFASSYCDEGATKALTEFMACPVEYSSNRNTLVFSQQHLSLVIPSGDDRLAEMHDQIALQALQHLNEGHRDVRYWIEQALLVGECNRQWVAKSLGISVSTLQRQLREQGESFKQLLEQTRKQQVEILLQQKVPLFEIAQRLGYQEQSNFQRAFKRWYGVSPRQYLRTVS